jgi:hypothetical protein
VPRTVGIRTEPCSELGDPTITTAPAPERYHLELVDAARLGAAGVGSEYLDEDELAARLRVSPKTIYRLRIRHQIPWIKLGRIVRYIQKDVEGFFGLLFIFLGVLKVFAGDIGDGLWIALIGFFLDTAAAAQVFRVCWKATKFRRR